MITIAKDNVFASLGRKLSNPAIGIKTYWSTLNKIVSKKKATNIRPLLENGLFVTIYICYYYIFIFDTMYSHFADNQLLTPNQSGFRPGDSTTNQLLYITQKIYTAFEEFP